MNFFGENYEESKDRFYGELYKNMKKNTELPKPSVKEEIKLAKFIKEKLDELLKVAKQKH